MPAKKTTQKGVKRPTSGLRPPTKKEHDIAVRRVDADMKKHGFKTLEELEAYYDSLRGY